MTKRVLPSNASVATQGDGARMIAPAASRNSDALCALLAKMAPGSGRALEIASGTGQHVAAFAQILPNLVWQPTEIDSERRASIDAYATDVSNILPATDLDATSAGWHEAFQEQDLIVLINLLHLISWPEADTFLSEASRALRPAGRLFIYGPFMRDGALTSPGDEKFHEALVSQDPEIGYKNDSEIKARLQHYGLQLLHLAEMPSNNLAFVAQRSKT
jgi:SAM-dependent methyltransferase